MTKQKYKSGNEFLPYHPAASHVEPSYRDGWNACWQAAIASREPMTEQQLEDSFPTNDSMSRKDALRWMARWTERFHGIG